MRQQSIFQKTISIVIIPLIAVFFLVNLSSSKAASDPAVPRGAALYDKWYAVKGATPSGTPLAGDMPLWNKQSSNTLSGPDTWRCTTCHGWDYRGKDGAYASGSNFTGFPGILNASQTMTKEKLIEQLTGVRDPLHDFSPYLNPENMNSLAAFIEQGVIDDSEFIDPITLKTIDSNPENGRSLYDANCAECHGNDGSKIRMRFDGQDAGLTLIASQDPWRFLHKTRYGTPGTEMVIGYDLGWTPEDGRDVLAYMQLSQSNPNELITSTGLESSRIAQTTPVGGPANNFFSGLLTIFGAMTIGLGINVLAAAALVGSLILIVWILRGK
jgi:mono/diheme cytochrome c family protein